MDLKICNKEIDKEISRLRNSAPRLAGRLDENGMPAIVDNEPIDKAIERHKKINKLIARKLEPP